MKPDLDTEVAVKARGGANSDASGKPTLRHDFLNSKIYAFGMLNLLCSVSFCIVFSFFITG